ncbi:MAG: hypothetical protein AB7O48_12960 [Cyclobacteriaceae bacterium]
MHLRVFFVICVVFALGCLGSCYEVICDDFKHYDYTQIEVTASKKVVGPKDDLTLIVNPIDFRFVAYQSSGIFGRAVAATSCDQGWGGPKFPIEKMEVFSDADFNDDFKAFDLLNDELYILDDNDNLVDIGDVPYREFTRLHFKNRPKDNKKFKFTVRVTRSDGSVIEGVSEEVRWIK